MDAPIPPSEAPAGRVGGAVTARSIPRRAALSCALIATFLFGGGGTSATSQRNGGSAPPIQSPDYSATKSSTNSLSGLTDLSEPTSRHEMEQKRGNMLNVERQKAMVREAGQLVQLAAELQLSLAKDPQGPAREEAVRRAETIEKLARNVKDRMKGGR